MVNCVAGRRHRPNSGPSFVDSTAERRSRPPGRHSTGRAFPALPAPTLRDAATGPGLGWRHFPTRSVTPGGATRDRDPRTSQDLPAAHRRRLRRCRRRQDRRGRQPGQRRGHRQRAGELAGGRRSGRRGRRHGLRDVEADDPAGPLAADAQDRRRARCQGRRARPARERQRRQAGRCGDRRDGHLRRPVPLLRRRRAGDGRPRRQRVPGRPHVDHPARPDRRRRVDRAVELPALHGDVEARARRSRPATPSC